MRSVKIALGSAVGLGVVLTGLIGFAHTRSGRPLLRLLGRVYQPSAAACPLGYDKVASPEQKEAGRKHFAALHPGAGAVASKPALGFVLDQTRQEDVLAWAKAHQVACKVTKTTIDLECTDVPAELLPDGLRAVGAQAVWLSFGSGDKLISVTTVRRSKEPEAISTAFQQFNQTLAKTTGGTPVENGTGTVDELKRGLLSQSSAEFKFHNYYALARATNMGDGFVLTEEYRSLPD